MQVSSLRTGPEKRDCREQRLWIGDKSPSHSFSRDRRAEIETRQGSSSAEISNPSAFMISLRSLCKEKFPLWTPLIRNILLLRGSLLDVHVIYQGVQAIDQTHRLSLFAFLIEVVFSEILVRGSVLQHVIDGGE